MKNVLRIFVIYVLAMLLLASVSIFSNQNALAQEEEPVPMPLDQNDPFYRQRETIEEKRLEYEHIVKEGQPSLEVFVNSSTTIAQQEILSGILGPPEGEDALGAIPALTNLMADMYSHKPASTHAYIAYVLQSARIIPQAQAQGIGFTSLNPILEVWKTFRNISYFLFVVIFIAIGFMIMFRHKISGQTVVTVEQAIPNVIVALLFVTFSYAIAGFMIDIMYLTMYLMIGLFRGSADMMNYNFLQLGVEMMRQGMSVGADSAIKSIVSNAGIAGIFEWITSLTLAVILGIAILFGIFKLFFELLKSYVSIVLGVAFAPLYLMAGAIPGQNTFNTWFRKLVGNLAAFPTVLLLLLVQVIIRESSLFGGRGGFMPPFLLNQGFGGALPAMVAIGILLAMPEAVKKVKETLGSKAGMFEELAGVAGGRFKQGAAIGAAPALGAQAGIAGLGIGAAKGAVEGARYWKGGAIRNANEYMQFIGDSAGKGGMIGASIPSVAQWGPGLVRKEVGVIKEQGEQIVAQQLTGGLAKRIEDWKAGKKKGAQERVVEAGSASLDSGASEARRSQQPANEANTRSSRNTNTL